MRGYVLIMVFLLMGAFFIISNGNLHLNNPNEVGIFIKSYYLWFGSLFENAKGMTAYVVKSEWLPDSKYIAKENSTNSSN